MFVGQSPEERELLGEELGWNPISSVWKGLKATAFGTTSKTVKIEVVPRGVRGGERYFMAIVKRKDRANIGNFYRRKWTPIQNFTASTKEAAVAQARQWAASKKYKIV